MQTGDQVVEVEEDHLAGRPLLEPGAPRVEAVMDLGAPLEVLVDHEDGRSEEGGGEQPEGQGALGNERRKVFNARSSISKPVNAASRASLKPASCLI